MNEIARSYAVSAIAASFAAGIGFAIHVFSAEIVERHVATMMIGRHVAPSWDMRFPAALSSIEQGLALVILYILLRRCFPALGTIRRTLLTAALALTLAGRLIRQPLMNILIGNPWEVVMMQDGLNWLIWLTMSAIVSVLLDALIPLSKNSHGNSL